ncbi:MAG: citrate synthase [Oscillospiraceae bacterium]|nr:citrate synthase [Oscillospiraceae bacterium]
MEAQEHILTKYMPALCADAADRYAIDPAYFTRVHRGLRNDDGTGVMIGATRIGSVRGYTMDEGERIPMDGQLYYRGISVSDLVQSHWENDTFGYEEVAYLLLLGKLPNQKQLDLFSAMLADVRPLPPGFFEDMILKNPSPDVMNGLARGVLALYAYDPSPEDRSVEKLMCQCVSLIARLPVIVAHTYAVKRHVYDGKSLYIHHPKDELSLAENFLRLARTDKNYTDAEAKLLDLMLILHAEHGGGNNSAFVCRALSSSGTDTYSAIAGAISSLKGPLHGGANAKVMEMFEYIRQYVDEDSSDTQIRDCLLTLLSGEGGDRSGKLYGLGHAVYTKSDPRAVIIKKYARNMAREKGLLGDMELRERVERIGVALLQEKKKEGFPMCANVDFYSGFVYSMLGIPADLYTPLFAIARIAGWCAHRIEEVLTGGRIMRPAYRAVMDRSGYVPMYQRT